METTPLYDLSRFSLAEMVRLGAALRQLGRDARSLEEAAGRIVRYLYRNVGDSQNGEPSLPLVRLFKTHPYSGLEPGQQEFVDRMLGQKPEHPEARCLTLMATAGRQSQWNDRHTSRGHQAIPLLSEDMVRSFPMIANLVAQFGLEVKDLVAPSSSLSMDPEPQPYNVFYVAEAPGSPHVVDQENFVGPHGIRSVLGLGGELPDGEFFALIMFSSTPIPPATAELFRTVALNVRVALSPLADTPFDSGVIHGLRRRRFRAADAVALRQVLEVSEQAVALQSSNLEASVAENAALADIGRIISSAPDIKDVYQRFVRAVGQVIPWERISINTLDPLAQTFESAYEAGLKMPGRSPGEIVPLAGSFTQGVLLAGHSMPAHPDSRKDLASQFPGLLPGFDMGLRSFLAVPLVSGGGEVGALHLAVTTPHGYTKEHGALAQRVADQIAGAVANARLYAAQLEAEAQIRSSLAEKELLVREIHHRVKNNLQVVYSLLEMQARRSRDRATKEALLDSQNRIMSMSSLHEQLFAQGNLGGISAAAYLSGVVAGVFQTHAVGTGPVTYNIDADGIELDADSAMSCGLIINELVTNSLKHAFPPGTPGRVEVALRQPEAGGITLVVRNDGLPMPQGEEMGGGTLGLHIVSTLAGHRGGSLAIHRGGGTEFVVELPPPAAQLAPGTRR